MTCFFYVVRLGWFITVRSGSHHVEKGETVEKEYTLVAELVDGDGGEWLDDVGIVAKDDAEAVARARAWGRECATREGARLVAWYALNTQGVALY